MANEMLTRLERVELIAQESNGQWIVPQLGQKGIRDHYEVRMLLEPAVLRELPEPFNLGDLDEKIGRIDGLLDEARPLTPVEIQQVEADLHLEIVMRCPNVPMRTALRRSQLPLIATHLSFDRYLKQHEMDRTLKEHLRVLRSLKSGNLHAAAQALEDHLRAAMESTLAYLPSMPPAPSGGLPAYLLPL